MSLFAKVRTHKLAGNASLCAAGFHQLGPDSPAVEAMTDFSRIQAVTISVGASLAETNAMMISRRVRLLMVVDVPSGRVEGLITARDILGEKPQRLAGERGVSCDELTVRDLMCPLALIDTFYLGEVLNARVIDILFALKSQGRQHILVEDSDPASGLPRVRGVFSATQIGRLMGVPVLGFDLDNTFAEIESALAD